MSDVPPPPPPPAMPPPPAGGVAVPGQSQWGPLASWGERVIGFLIDWVIVVVPLIALYILAFIFGAIVDILFIPFFLLAIVWGFAGAFYIIGFNNGLGASPGKKVTGLRVVGEQTGQPIGGGMGIVRHLAHFLDGLCCYIGYLWPLWDAKRQTFADKVMKTVVTSGHDKTDIQSAIKSSLPIKQG
ncbi:MAG TPA: RDD family protein [Acidimicrobiales bacterium]